MALPGIAHAASLPQTCVQRNEWICPEYVRTRAGLIGDALLEHVTLTVVSLLIGFVIALPLAVLIHRFGRLETPLVGLATLLYTVPSLAMFSLLLPITGLSAATVVVGLALYTLTILVRGTLAGLQNVPAEARDAAVGMGFGPGRLLWKVELPLAMPAMFAGLRVAAVSTVALTTIGAIVGFGGLGNLIASGLTSLFRPQVLTAAVLCVLLAVLADGLLLLLQRGLTPWTRGRTA